MKPVTVKTLQAKKAAGEKFAVVAAYDATFAGLIAEAGIDSVLVGDSLGMVLQGHDSTLPVSVDDICYHTAAVARGAKSALVIADMPFASYHSAEAAVTNASRLMRAGAHVVKLEGGAWLADSVRQLVRQGIPVCAHLGLTPQSVNLFGGFRMQGKAPEQARSILDDARTLEQAGADLLVLECVPRELGTAVAEALRIPVIGIGAGAGTDGQVLVVYDLLGMSPHSPRFVRNFLSGSDSVQAALAAYREAVEGGEFPAPEHGFD